MYTSMMINPFEITNFERTEKELQTFMLFCVCVAGKNAQQQAAKLEKFLNILPGSGLPFDRIRDLVDVKPYLVEVRMGQYHRIGRAFKKLSELPQLDQVEIEQLELIKGIGPKTSRFFVLHSRPNSRVAVLDTHILRYMRETMGLPAPKSTPGLKRYYELETQFLEHCDARSCSPAQLDLEIWSGLTKSRPAPDGDARELSTV